MKIVRCEDCGNHHRAGVECPFCLDKSVPIPPRAPVEGSDSRPLSQDELDAIRLKREADQHDYDEAES